MSSNNGSNIHSSRGSLTVKDVYSNKQKLFGLWLVQNLESHMAICLKKSRLIYLLYEYIILLNNFTVNKQE